MDDQLDKDLSKRIKEVFDNHEDPSADAGWLELRKKFPEEKQRRGFAWLLLAAALLLLFLGIGLVVIFMKKQPVKNQVAHNAPIQKLLPETLLRHNDSAANRSQAIVASGITKDENAGKAQQASVANNTPKANKYRSANHVLAKNNPARPAKNKLVQLAAVINNSSAPAAHGGLSQSVNTTPSHQSNENQPVAEKGSNPVTQPNTTQLAIVPGSRPVITDTSNKKQVAQVKKPVKTIEDMFAADQGSGPDKTRVKSDKKVTFGVYASTYFNYARSANNQVNTGAGLTAAIPLAKNLKLVTGVSINQNSFDYNNSGLFAAAAPYALYNNNTLYSTANNATYSQSASLLGLDVPVNLQYKFNTRKNQLYVLGGFSSGTFINESYNYLYANGNSTTFQPNKDVNDFYFARTLNFAFGVGYPLGKNQIVIEPFFKYPLEGLGAEQLHFGASGVNLKFNFSTKK
jgi:hypothetical protein